ncbi:hypothetical protein H1R20_g7239, partial [Candolleomyces eurysporus]
MSITSSLMPIHRVVGIEDATVTAGRPHLLRHKFFHLNLGESGFTTPFTKASGDQQVDWL